MKIKGKIDKEGTLHILRKGEWVTMRCKNVKGRYCEDCCPAFSRPIVTDLGSARLSLCDNIVWTFDEFKDDRKSKGA